MNNLDRTAPENARHIAALMRVEADKFGRSYYRLTKRSYDRCLLYYGLEQVMLNLARELEAETFESPTLRDKGSDLVTQTEPIY